MGGAEKKSEKKAIIQRPGKRPIKRPARHLSDDDSPDEQETLGTCFKDSDYGGYPHSLSSIGAKLSICPKLCMVIFAVFFLLLAINTTKIVCLLCYAVSSNCS